jgi:hypothetical protein
MHGFQTIAMAFLCNRANVYPKSAATEKCTESMEKLISVFSVLSSVAQELVTLLCGMI